MLGKELKEIRAMTSPTLKEISGRKRFKFLEHLTIKEFAVRCGVSPSKMSEYELGSRKIPAYIEKLVKCLSEKDCIKV